jgi:hypothetical protein
MKLAPSPAASRSKLRATIEVARWNQNNLLPRALPWAIEWRPFRTLF